MGSLTQTQINADWNAVSGPAFILNKPTIGPTITNVSQLTNDSGYVTAATAPVKSVFGRTGIIAATTGDYTVSQITGAAPLASPVLSGTPQAPTASPGTNTTQIATTAFVTAACAAVSISNFLRGLADVNVTEGSFIDGYYLTYQFSTSRWIATAFPTTLNNTTFTGTINAPTPTVGNNSTLVATTAFVTTAINNAFATPPAENAQTGTTYTLALNDALTGVSMNNSASNVITVPNNSTVAFPLNVVVPIDQLGAGQTSVVGASGVTILTASSLNARTQYSSVGLKKIGTNTWIFFGDMQ